MRERFQKLIQEIKTILLGIQAGDILALYAAIWGVIFLGAVVILAQRNIFTGIVLLFFSPIPIFIFTVITKLLVDKFARMLPASENKQKEMKLEFPNVSWDMVDFIPWNPKMNITSAICGIEIINNSEHKINECFVELIALYDENNGEYINPYEELKAQLPCKLVWQLHNEFVHGNIDVEKDDSRYLAISFYEEFLSIKGDRNFVHAWIPQGHTVTKIKVWGKFGNETLPSKILFVEMFSNGRRVTTRAITDQLQNLPPILERFSFYLDEMILVACQS
jgi:hypothetical protein